MLTVPAFNQYGDVTVYRDDTDFFRFYALPAAPRLRTAGDGTPVLSLVVYALSDEERHAHPELGGGGGYLAFDSAFGLTATELDALRPKLQPIVDADWQRFRSGTAEEQAKPGVAGTTSAPQVEFAAPTWTAGKVKMDVPQSELLVAARVAEADVSLLTGNVAVFNVDLTPAGATFMKQTLLAAAGSSAAIPIQVAYDLKMWGRLPPARIHVEVNAERLYEYVHKQMQGRGIDECTTYDYDHTDIDEASLTLSGAVTVQIDTGSGSLPDDVVAELRKYAFDTLKQLVQSTFFTPAPAPPPPQDGAPSPRAFRFGATRKLVSKQLDHQTMSIKMDIEQSSVVEWPLHPQGTLQGLLGSASPTSFVRTISLEDDFFANLEVEVDIFTDWTKVQHVEVALQYSGTDANGVHQVREQVLVFDRPGSKSWSTPLLGSNRAYRYRSRAVLAGRAAPDFPDWSPETTQPMLPISIASPGIVSADVIAASVDFTSLVASVQVRFAYEDPAHGVPREEDVVVLTAASPTGHYEREIGTVKAGTLLHKVRFDLRSGDVVEDEDWTPVDGRVVVNQPSESVLRVSLLPTGRGWSGVMQVMVDLKYDDPANAMSVSDTIPLKKLDQFATWQVYLKDRNKRAYRYRWAASFANGQLTKIPWTDNPGDDVLPIALDRPGVDVLVVADALDFTTCPLTEVTLRHASSGEEATLVFRDKTAQVWHLDAAETPLQYEWQATHYPPGRDPVVLPKRQESDAVVVLPAYQATRAGELRVQLLGQLVDWVATPIVGVDLAYDDQPNAFHSTTAITLTAAKTATEWVLATKDASVTTFRYRITYFTKDGRDHPVDWVTAEVPRIVVPAYQPT